MDHSEFGTYLAQQRELRGMTREEVAARTKISPSLLQALESGNAERLPERIFVTNYVRQYAQVIGLSPEEAVLRFEEIYGGASAALSPVQRERRRNRTWGIVIGVAVALSAAGGALLWLGVGG